MTDRPLRADAQRNRDALLAAAAPAFAAKGADASLEEIARQAGVAIGTLYRHFPTREALFVAVHRAEMINVAEHADALLITYEPLIALRLWLGRFTDFMTAKHGMADAPSRRARSKAADARRLPPPCPCRTHTPLSPVGGNATAAAHGKAPHALR